MKVLVSDNLGEVGIQLFKQEEGIDVDVKTGLTPEELKAIIGEYDGLAIRSATKVTEDILEAAQNLKVVGRAGIGLDNVDIPAATKRGVVVMNTPGGNTVTTAEHAVAMMMALTRNIPQGTSTLKDGKWEKKKLQGREIMNKTLGLIGFGNIGSIVADRARGLKMKVVIFDPNVTAERIEEAGFEAVTLEQLYERADYITIHVPKIKSTENLLNKEAFAKMKDEVMIINCARGGIINEDDLYDAIQSGKVAGAALDVFSTEPPGDSKLFTLDRVVGTPHLGASTREAQTNVAVAVARQIIEYLKNNTIINAVNVPSITGDLLVQLQPFLTLGDRLGSILTQITSGPLKEVAIEYTGKFMGLDIAPVTTAIIQGLLTPCIKEMVNSVNALSMAKDMGIKVTESKNPESENFHNLITVTLITKDMTNTISGTIFGKSDPRVVRINSFRLEMIPEGHLAIIHNLDRPGAIGSVGALLGDKEINISAMTVGRADDGERNIIFLRTDTPIPDEIKEALCDLPMVKDVMTLTV